MVGELGENQWGTQEIGGDYDIGQIKKEISFFGRPNLINFGRLDYMDPVLVHMAPRLLYFFLFNYTFSHYS